MFQFPVRNSTCSMDQVVGHAKARRAGEQPLAASLQARHRSPSPIWIEWRRCFRYSLRYSNPANSPDGGGHAGQSAGPDQPKRTATDTVDGPGHTFKVDARVRIPLGVPAYWLVRTLVGTLVRFSACQIAIQTVCEWRIDAPMHGFRVVVGRVGCS